MKNPADIPLWTRLYKQSPVASFFQSPHWAMIWQRYTANRFRPAPLLGALPSGRKILLPMSTARVAGGLVGWQHLAPAGTYGGWLSADREPIQSGDLSQVLALLGDTGISTTFRWFPFIDGDRFAGEPGEESIAPDAERTGVDTGRVSDAPDAERTGADTGRESDAPDTERTGAMPGDLPSGWKATPEFTRVLDCSKGFDAIVQQWRSSRSAMMRNLRKAEKSGVQVRLAQGPEDRSAYHALYLSAVRSWHPAPGHVYGAHLWDILAEYEPESRLWLAEYEGRIIAGAVLLYGVKHVAYWHGASDAELRGVRPVNLLLAKAIEDACERGYCWFDFNPGGGLQGVDRFKASFGAVRVACPVFERRTLAAAFCLRVSRLRQRTGKRAAGRVESSRGDT